MDGIYSSDPNITTMAKKLDEISFDEMQEIADAGAKVLHNRCIQIGKKFNCDIEAKSTFVDKRGTRICKEIENTEIKSIVKNANLIKIKVFQIFYSQMWIFINTTNFSHFTFPVVKSFEQKYPFIESNVTSVI